MAWIFSSSYATGTIPGATLGKQYAPAPHMLAEGNSCNNPFLALTVISTYLCACSHLSECFSGHDFSGMHAERQRAYSEHARAGGAVWISRMYGEFLELVFLFFFLHPFPLHYHPIIFSITLRIQKGRKFLWFSNWFSDFLLVSFLSSIIAWLFSLGRLWANEVSPIEERLWTANKHFGLCKLVEPNNSKVTSIEPDVIKELYSCKISNSHRNVHDLKSSSMLWIGLSLT